MQAFRAFAISIAVSALSALALALPAGATHSSTAAKCSTWGITWRKTYNRKAIRTGNPTRILSACCQPTARRGVNHCFVSVGLAGTPSIGCESTDIGLNGLPVLGTSKHESCLTHS